MRWSENQAAARRTWRLSASRWRPQTPGKQPDVEPELPAAQVEFLLAGGEQVHQQRAESGPLR